MKEQLQAIFEVLDRELGDTDPDITDMADEVIREEFPVFWAAREIMRLLEPQRCPACGSENTVAHTDEELRRRHKLVRQCFACGNFLEMDWELPDADD